MQIIDGKAVATTVKEELYRELPLLPQKPTVGIIGATTHTGELVSKLVPSLDRIEGLVLLGRTQSNLDNLAKDCLVINPDLKVWAGTDWNKLASCDFVLLTAYINGDQSQTNNSLKSGSVFIGIVEPISPFVLDLKKVLITPVNV